MSGDTTKFLKTLLPVNSVDNLMSMSKIDQELEKIIDEIVTACYSDIMKHSMQHFMKLSSVEDRWRIALNIARMSYEKAILEMNKFFLEKYNTPQPPRI